MRPVAIESRAGRLIGVLWSPPNPAPALAAVMFAPPFAEELNKCRRMMTLQAQSLAAAGFYTLLLDVHGTGDSEGDFGEATWERWLVDLASGAEWLRSLGTTKLSLIGVRAGALMALEACPAFFDLHRLVLWAPVASGAQHLAQFLRLKVAGGTLAASESRTSAADLRASLKAGDALEIAGYTLAPALASSLESRSLERFASSWRAPTLWIDRAVGPRAADPSGALAARLREAGAPLTRELLSGEPFWSTVEIGLAPDWIERTTQWLLQECAGAP
jgi:exosortase A-associated hydrolase 2